MISIFKNWGTDVVAIINGQVITKADILESKRQRQRRLLERKLAGGNVQRPCFIWAFCNDGWMYGDWWVYIRTLHGRWGIAPGGRYDWLVPKVMALYPCGYEPVKENFRAWVPVFAEAYHRPTVKRPNNNGLAIARCLIAPCGQPLDVAPW